MYYAHRAGAGVAHVRIDSAIAFLLGSHQRTGPELPGRISCSAI